MNKITWKILKVLYMQEFASSSDTYMYCIICMFKTVINANCVAVTLLEQRPEKIQALSWIRTHDLCDAGAVLSLLSYQSHMRVVVYGLAL